jgi:hypothetical protein
MSLSITALIIILLLIPGILFRRAYYIYPFSRKYTINSTFDEISVIVIPSIIFHIIGFWILRKTPDFDDFKNLLYFLTELLSVNSMLNISVVSNKYPFDFNQIIYCFAILWCSSYYIGLTLNQNIRKLKLDAKFKFFRYKNEWYYYLTGRVLDFPNVIGESSKINMTLADVLIKGNNEYYLYRGILWDYYLSENGGLSCICLKQTYRTLFNIDSLKYDFKKIEGDYYIIQAGDIISFNLRYFHQKESIPRFKNNSISKIITEILLFVLDVFTLAYPIYLIFKLTIWVSTLLYNAVVYLINWINRVFCKIKNRFVSNPDFR